MKPSEIRQIMNDDPMRRIGEMAAVVRAPSVVACQPSALALAPCSAAYRRTCQRCQGTGEIHWSDGSKGRGFFTIVACRRCMGTGKITIKPNAELTDANNERNAKA